MRKFYPSLLANCKKSAIAFLAVLFCLMANVEKGLGQITQTYSTPGTYTFTVPAGVNTIKIEAWGGGAGGSTGYGGGGAYAGNFTQAVTAGNNYTVTVGAGGAALNPGNSSSFASLVIAAGGSGVNGGTTASSTGVIKNAGGNGGTNVAFGGSGGGGSGGAGGGGGVGINGSGNTGGAGGAGGVAGAGSAGAPGGAGGNINVGGNPGNFPGGGGGENGNGGLGSKQGANGQVIITYTPPYQDQFSALTAGSTTWCAGETRSITINVKNTGSAAWTSAATAGSINLSYWWTGTTNQTHDTNPRQYPFSNLISGQSKVVTISVTAPATPGNYVLNFDLVKENLCWFSDNITNCSGPGNTIYNSSGLTVLTTPTPTFTASPGATTCSGVNVTYTTQAGQSNYVWSVPGVAGTDYTITSGGIGAANSTVTLKWLTSGGKTVTVNYTSGSCSGLSAASNTTTVSISPTPTFTASPGATTCSGVDITYTTQAGQSNYVWSVPGVAGTDYSITSGGIGAANSTVNIRR
jgi:hypothetical protein